MIRFPRWLVFIYMRQTASIRLSFMYKDAKRKFLRKAWPYRCAWCDEVAYKGHRSVDHIVPQWLCVELELYELITDSRNFQVMHPVCNGEKGGEVTIGALKLIAEYIGLGQMVAAEA
jgi:hypothetical protein